MKKALLLFCLLYSIHSIAQTTFNKRFRLGFPATVFTSVIVNDSNYVVTGLSLDSIYPYKEGALFTKFDFEGNPILVKGNHSANETYEPWFPSLTQLSDGSFILTGTSNSPYDKGLIIKYSQDGDILWLQQYDDFLGLQLQHFLKNIIPIDNDNFLAISDEFDPPNKRNISIRKINSVGEIIWAKYYDAPLRQLCFQIRQTNDNEWVIGGLKTNTVMADHDYISQSYIFAIDSLGEVLWEKLSPIDILQDAASDIVVTADGGLVIASQLGYELEHPAGSFHFLPWDDNYIYKLNSEREIEWEVVFQEPYPSIQNRLTRLIELEDKSGYVAVGEGTDFNGTDGEGFIGRLLKVSAAGDSVWSRKLIYHEHSDSNQFFHNIYDIKETPDKGFIMVGQTKHTTADYPQRGWILKVDSMGCLVPGCGDIIDATDHLQKQAAQLSLYPNPAQDYLNVFCKPLQDFDKARLQIIDQAGRIRKTFSIRGEEATHFLPVYDLEAGLYFLQFNSDVGSFGLPFFVEGT